MSYHDPIDKRKPSLYLGKDIIKELRRESRRQGRPMSWLVQQAWKLARAKIKAVPVLHKKEEK